VRVLGSFACSLHVDRDRYAPPMKKLRLGIDLDGVVADFTAGWMNFYNQEHGTQLAVEDSISWDGLVDLTHFKNMGEFWDWSSDLEGRSVFWHLEPFPGSIEALNALAEDGHHIAILTTKPDFAIHDTMDWLARHRLPTKEIHILEDKWRVECDIYLDDSPHVLPRLAKERPESVVCRYVRPWNRPVDGTVDVNDFNEFREVVGDFA
jgi:5'(3')-deoxyribonucleotidase